MPAMKSLMLSVALLAACGASQKEVAVQGKDLDLARVAGDWEGEYKGNESGRTGPVTFSLAMGSHTAEGQVVMSGTTPLKIEFVKVKDDEVRGTIAPYTDPSCSCEVQTTFNGIVANDSISGTFETKVSGTDKTQSGSWFASRKR
jgi:hypothetical protein